MMNFFTQTVDATLWASRTYEDAEYDTDAVSAEEGRKGVTVTLNSDTPSINKLFVVTGKHSQALLEHAFTETSLIGSITLPAGEKVSIHAIGSCAVETPVHHAFVVVHAEIPAHLHASFAQEIVKSLSPKAVIALCIASSRTLLGSNDSESDSPATRALHASTGKGYFREDLVLLTPPAFLSGAAAAVLAECEMCTVPASVVVRVIQAEPTVADLMELYDVVMKAVGKSDGLRETSDFEKGVRIVLQNEASSRAMMYI